MQSIKTEPKELWTSSEPENDNDSVWEMVKGLYDKAVERVVTGEYTYFEEYKPTPDTTKALGEKVDHLIWCIFCEGVEAGMNIQKVLKGMV